MECIDSLMEPHVCEIQFTGDTDIMLLLLLCCCVVESGRQAVIDADGVSCCCYCWCS